MGCFGKKEDAGAGGDRSKEILKSKRTPSNEPAKDLSKRDLGLARTAGEGGVTEEITEKGGVLYEDKGNCEVCRSCENVFAIANTKVKALVKLERHHCRSCGGVFCDKCTQYELQVPGSFDPYRCCPGCWRGEMPGDLLKEKLTHILELRGERKGVVLKPARALTLTRGEKYLNVPSSDVPISGYLEFVNKLPEGGGGGKVCCLKVLYGGGDTKFEVPRPSYIAVPPGEVVHCSFPSDTNFLEILVLFGNNSPGLAHVFETRAESMTADRISNSAKVSLFPYVAAYKAKVTDKNVFLKYKGEGNVEVRAGNNVSRIGLAAKLSRTKKKTSQIDSLDFATNISEIEKLFQY